MHGRGTSAPCSPTASNSDKTLHVRGHSLSTAWELDEVLQTW